MYGDTRTKRFVERNGVKKYSGSKSDNSSVVIHLGSESGHVLVDRLASQSQSSKPIEDEHRLRLASLYLRVRPIYACVFP